MHRRRGEARIISTSRAIPLGWGIDIPPVREPDGNSQHHAPMNFTIAEIANQIRGEVIGNGSTQITGFSSAEAARPGDLTFADKEAYFIAAEKSQASAILVSGPFVSA